MTRTGISAGMLAILSAPTPPGEVKQRKGPGGLMLDYIDARFVMDRLDEIGGENWQDQFVDRSDGSVRCGIGILVDGEWVWKWDVGVASDIEPEKGAYSESFKRAGVKWGIARDLYGHPASSGRAPIPPAPRPSTTPRPAVAPPSARDGDVVSDEPPWLESAFDSATPPVMTPRQAEEHAAEGFCPDHGLAWTLRPAGTSKATGKDYPAFYACPSTDRPFCKQKPSAKWQALQELAS